MIGVGIDIGGAVVKGSSLVAYEQTITSGTGTWTRPAGAVNLIVELWSPGAAGGAASGGGGGGYCRKTYATPAASYPYGMSGGDAPPVVWWANDTVGPLAVYADASAAGYGYGGDVSRNGGNGDPGNGPVYFGGGGGGAGGGGNGGGAIGVFGGTGGIASSGDTNAGGAGGNGASDQGDPGEDGLAPSGGGGSGGTALGVGGAGKIRLRWMAP